MSDVIFKLFCLLPAIFIGAFFVMYRNDKAHVERLIPKKYSGYMFDENEKEYSDLQLAYYNKQIKILESLLKDQIELKNLILLTEHDEKVIFPPLLMNKEKYYVDVVYISKKNIVKECGLNVTVENFNIVEIQCYQKYNLVGGFWE